MFADFSLIKFLIHNTRISGHFPTTSELCRRFPIMIRFRVKVADAGKARFLNSSIHLWGSEGIIPAQSLKHDVLDGYCKNMTLSMLVWAGCLKLG